MSDKDPKKDSKDEFLTKLKEHLASEEGSSSTLYLDSKGIPTIGVGVNALTNKREIINKTPYTEDSLEADIRRLKDLGASIGIKKANKRFEKEASHVLVDTEVKSLDDVVLNRIVSEFEGIIGKETLDKYSPDERAALTSLYFNGGKKLIGPRITKAIKSQNKDAILQEMTVGSVGDVGANKNTGIAARRLNEAFLFTSGNSDRVKKILKQNSDSPGFKRIKDALDSSDEARQRIDDSLQQFMNNLSKIQDQSNVYAGLAPDGSIPTTPGGLVASNENNILRVAPPQEPSEAPQGRVTASAGFTPQELQNTPENVAQRVKTARGVAGTDALAGAKGMVGAIMNVFKDRDDPESRQVRKILEKQKTLDDLDMSRKINRDLITRAKQSTVRQALKSQLERED